MKTGVFPKKAANPFRVIGTAISTAQGLRYLLFAGLAGCTVIIIKKFFRSHPGKPDEKRNLYIAEESTYGSAGWMSEQELHSCLNQSRISDTDGVILGVRQGRAVSLPLDSELNKHIAVYGASGTMKSRAFARPYIFQAVKRGESLVMTDSKGELYADLSEYLRENGYNVKVFNLVSPTHSDGWNCLAEIGTDELMAQTFTQIIIDNTNVGNKGDHFWDNAEANLLKALALYIQMSDDIDASEKTIGKMYRLLLDKKEFELDALFEILPDGHMAKAPYAIFKQSSATIRSSVIIGLGSRLQVLQNEVIRSITSYNEIDLEQPAKEKCAYFCIISDQDTTLEFLSSLFFSFLFIKLVRYADTKTDNGRCPIPVNIILEEFPQIGRILDINKKISVIRSRAINLTLIFQNIGQLKNRYPDDVWLELLGACDTQIYLGCTDPLTAEYVSNRTGDITVIANGQRYNRSAFFRSPVYGDSYSQGRRKLLTPDEVLRFPNTECLIFLRGHNALQLTKLDYTKFPQAKRLKIAPASQHIPAWSDVETQRSNSIVSTTAEPKTPSRAVKTIKIHKNKLF